MENELDPKFRRLSIYHRSPSNIVGESKVDTELWPFLSLWNWYIADKRVASPPRATIRFERRGKTHKFDMQQNRLVYKLSTLSGFTERMSLVELPPAELFEHLDKLPRLRFRDNDPFNCTMENITTWVPTVGVARFSPIEIDVLPPQTSTAPVPATLPPKEKENSNEVL